jgi:hypothetical protein
VFHRFLAILAILGAVSGCESLPKDPYIDCNSKFSKVITTEFTGKMIAEWTAAGKVSYDSADGGYTFLAVEKIDYGRLTQTRRYVIGRPVKVMAPNVAVYEVEPPEWICRGGELVSPVGTTK